MKIILSPSKEMAFEKNIDKKIKLNEISQEILDEIKKMSKADLQKILKVSDKIIDEVYGYYQDFDNNPAYYAIDMYKGMAFKEIDFGRLIILPEIILLYSPLFMGRLGPTT